ncbi:MAG: hypothetical protein QUU85_15555, partial [Candidatus Eisenbacteria bacterium]|nr:hypothetical protein [Candidatus Eisenbacteria bacterium]
TVRNSSAASDVYKRQLQRSLQEILATDAARLATYRYQVQNVYFDHEGQWSAEKDGEGTSLFAFPNPPEGD